MIRHIVMFKLKQEYSAEEKAKYAAEIKEKLVMLPAKIPVIKKYEVGLDVLQTDRSYDIVLIAEFEDIKALDKYTVHPDHQEAVVLIRKHRNEIAVLDYKF
ncbi:MAG: hypothetical protein A2W91_17650 [Bacteroidetes bacterium GWF2_38_335]|nr:MAG: hypothetical protein A2W91_17650 [Bacteroidetes bacterium GWF2_38_335]OFY78041.1 MAG: hypothetical protein A2281_18810 [Bacteroidetes bacterium RIFOXYA12_FULL_38_20]HBS88313.1 stress responsive protein [Bacteroidales bacterium]